MQTTADTSDVIDTLNHFLRGEISAVETYRQALEKISEPALRMELEQCRRSHQQRVDVLRRRVAQLGGRAADGSGAWGAFARLIEGSAKLFGEKTAIAALEEGEDRGLRDYRNDLHKLDEDSRQLVSMQVLPAQEQTHRAMSSLKRTPH